MNDNEVYIAKENNHNDTMRSEYNESIYLRDEQVYSFPINKSKDEKELKKKKHKNLRRLVMALASSAMIVVVAASTDYEDNIHHEKKYTEGFQIRTEGTVGEAGLYYKGYRSAMDEEIIGMGDTHIGHYILLGNDDNVVLTDNVLVYEEGDRFGTGVILGEGNDKVGLIQIKLSAPGFKFEKANYTGRKAALVFYNGKIQGTIKLRRDFAYFTQLPKDWNTSDEYIKEHYAIRYQDVYDGQWDEDAKELFDRTYKLSVTEETCDLVVGDSLKITLDVDTYIRGKDEELYSIWLRNEKEASSFTLFKYFIQTDKHYNTENIKFEINMPVKDENTMEFEMYPLHQTLYTLQEHEKIITTFETVNDINWRICTYKGGITCFCEEEPGVFVKLFEKYVYDENGNLNERILEVLQEFELIK